MKIGEAAKLTGLGIETIRFYEREGLIKPEKLSSGYRTYTDDLILKMKFIIQAKSLGFSLKETKELLSLHANTKSKCSSVRKKAQSKVNEIEQKLDQLKSMRTVLKKLIKTCESEGTTDCCPILDAICKDGGRDVKD